MATYLSSYPMVYLMTQPNQTSQASDSEAPIHRNQQDIRAQNQAVILAAAEEEFVLQSYRGATMQGIAGRAGVSTACVHCYFRDRENLYKMVLRSIIEEWNDGLVTMTV